MSYGQSSYGGGEYGSAIIVVQPERIELGALTVGIMLHAPVLRTSDALTVPILTIAVTMHEPALHEPAVQEPAVPIAQHIRQMAVRRLE